MSETWIAEESVVFVHPDGTRQAGRIAVGLPVDVSGAEATCAMALDGLHSQLRPAHGASNLQALTLALRFVGTQLHHFVSRGGRVLHRSEEFDLPLEAYLGPLLQVSSGRPGSGPAAA